MYTLSIQELLKYFIDCKNSVHGSCNTCTEDIVPPAPCLRRPSILAPKRRLHCRSPLHPQSGYARGPHPIKRSCWKSALLTNIPHPPPSLPSPDDTHSPTCSPHHHQSKVHTVYNFELYILSLVAHACNTVGIFEVSTCTYFRLHAWYKLVRRRYPGQQFTLFGTAFPLARDAQHVLP